MNLEELQVLFYTRTTSGVRNLKIIKIPLEWKKDILKIDYNNINKYLKNFTGDIEDYEEITFNMGDDSDIVTFLKE